MFYKRNVSPHHLSSPAPLLFYICLKTIDKPEQSCKDLYGRKRYRAIKKMFISDILVYTRCAKRRIVL